jgi:RNA polymerase sigma-70 factor (ECF subfamily)
MDDIKLLRLLQKNPDKGMERLMDQYAGLVFSVVKTRLATSYCISSDIEDCVADVFSEFYLGLSKYDAKKSSIKSYLCVLARNNAIDILRQRANHGIDLSFDDDESYFQIADDFDMESEIKREELRREIFSLIKNLGEPDTSIIIRKYYLGESSKEIAAALSLSVSNVDTRAHRALSKLRKLFGGKEL